MGVFHKIMDFLGLSEEREEKVVQDNHEQPFSANRNHNVVSLKQVKTNTKLVLSQPYSFEEAQDIADHLRNKRSVILNLHQVDDGDARRILDFLSGTVYAISGEIQKLSNGTFLFTPDNVEIEGSITGKMFDESIKY